MRLFEKRVLVRLMMRANGRVSKAAALAGRNRSYFHRQLQHHGINPKDYRLKYLQVRASVREKADAKARQDASIIRKTRKSYFGVPVE